MIKENYFHKYITFKDSSVMCCVYVIYLCCSYNVMMMLDTKILVETMSFTVSDV